jgi:uncharacterized membrane protein
MNSQRKDESFTGYFILIIIAFLILIFVLYSYSPFAYPPVRDACMQNPMGGNILLNNILLVVVALLFIYAIYGIATSSSSDAKESIQSIENTESQPLHAQLDTAYKTENGKDKIELAKKLLNEDEGKVLEIIFANEGVTQDSLHFRTGFSHSKLSMIIKKLEEKDIILRERLGKTYKLFLSDWIKNQ